jgi:hypothetical protein
MACRQWSRLPRLQLQLRRPRRHPTRQRHRPRPRRRLVSAQIQLVGLQLQRAAWRVPTMPGALQLVV